MSKLTIIGDGTVGSSLGKAIGITPIGPGDEKIETTVAIICVPTPTIDGKQDLTNVKQALSRISADLIVIRSTILPGTTDNLQQETDIPIIFIPEFGKEKTMDKDMAYPDIYLVGYTDKSREKLNLAVMGLPMAKQLRVMPARIAEYAKYFSNIWKFNQVMIANSLYDWAKEDYQDVLDNLLALPDISQWGWEVNDEGYRGASGKCLPKDFGAALGVNPNNYWQELKEYNDKLLSNS